MTNPQVIVDGVATSMGDAELAAFTAAQVAAASQSATMQSQFNALLAMPGLPAVLGIIVDAFTQLGVDVTKFTPAQRAIIQQFKNSRATLGV